MGPNLITPRKETRHTVDDHRNGRLSLQTDQSLGESIQRDRRMICDLIHHQQPSLQPTKTGIGKTVIPSHIMTYIASLNQEHVSRARLCVSSWFE